jgi:predicted nucleic acid-binding protein
MEVMAGAEGRLEAPTRSLLDGFETTRPDAQIAEKAVSLRQERRIKVPDAIIWISAQVNGMILVTRNTKVFPAVDPGVRVPYGAHF